MYNPIMQKLWVHLFTNVKFDLKCMERATTNNHYLQTVDEVMVNNTIRPTSANAKSKYPRFSKWNRDYIHCVIEW